MSERKIKSVEVLKTWPNGPEVGLCWDCTAERVEWLPSEESILANENEFFKVTYEDEAPEKKKTRFEDVRVRENVTPFGTRGLAVIPPGGAATVSLTDLGPGWYERNGVRSRVVGYNFEGSDMVMASPVAWWWRREGGEFWILAFTRGMEDGYECRAADLEFVQFEVEE